jgi:RNA polymerase sigma factor for flagellar operon FliA
LQQLTSAVLTSFMLSLDAFNFEVADPKNVSVEDVLLERDAQRQLRDAVAQLPENNRRLIELYYFQDATLEEIGRRLGLSKSWVCRMHAKSLDMLRSFMGRPGGKAAAR